MTDFDPTYAWRLGSVPNLVWPATVIARTNTPPSSPATNDCYIVNTNPNGEWIDKGNQIAIRTSEGQWTYQKPARGRRVYVQATKAHLEFNGREWVPQSGLPPGGLTTYVLAKASDADGDALWTEPGLIGVGGGGTTVKLFQKIENITGSEPEGTLAIVLGQGVGAYPERGAIYERIGLGWTSRGYISQVGVPEGGTTGQILAKSSGDDFEVEWLDLEEAVGDITSVTAGEGLIGGGSAGAVTVAVDWGTDYLEVRHGNDAAYTNARAPTGTAAGDLGATYPNPSVIALTADATRLTLGTIADGEFVQRSGTTLVGVSGTSSPQPVEVNGTLIGTRDAIDIVAGTGISLSGADDSSNNRVRVTVTATGGGGGGVDAEWRFPYLAKPASPDSWNFEARDASDPDLATNGFTVQLYLSPYTTLTRSGNVDVATTPSAGTYRSTIYNGVLFLQLPTATDVTVAKATGTGYTHKFHVWNTQFEGANNTFAWISNNLNFGQSGNTTYYVAVNNGNNEEVTFIGPSAFTTHQALATTSLTVDQVRQIDDHGTSRSSAMIMPWSGSSLLARASRTTGGSVTIAYAGVWLKHTAGQFVYIDFIRRTPLLELP